MVSRIDAESLYQRVASFLLLVKKMCDDKIELVDQEAALHAIQKNTEAVQVGTTGQLGD